MNITQNLQKVVKLILFRQKVSLSCLKSSIHGCGSAGARNSTSWNVEATKRSCNRNYSTSATTVHNIVQEIPEPRGVYIFGTLFSLLSSGGAQKLHEYVDKRHNDLGPIYREQIGPVKAIFVNSPQEFRRIFRLEGPTPKHFIPEAWLLYNEVRKCQRGLLFMDGKEWLDIRKILNRVMLTSDATISMYEPCEKVAKELAEKWKEQIKSNNIISDLETQLYQWSIEAMLATLMGSSWNRYKERVSDKFVELAKLLHKIFEYSARLSMLPAKLAMNLRLSSWNNFVLCVDTALEIVRILVLEMIQLKGDGLLKKMLDEGIQEEDAVKIITDFILAAGDTTAASIQWTLLLLSRHAECQERLFESIRYLSPKELLRDPLLKGTIKEALRLYPIAPFITRYLPQDSTIGGYVVPKGELLLLSIYSSGRNANNFSRPNEFFPERWIRTKEGSYEGVIHPHASLPFALGVRSCIGRKLAETQMSLALAQLIKNFKIDCMNKDRIELILHLISVPSEGIQLKLTSRF